MKLENIMLSGKKQSQKATYCMTALISNVQDTGIESKLVADRGMRRIGTANRFGVMGFPVGAMEIF